MESENRTFIIVIVVVVLLAGAGFYVWRTHPDFFSSAAADAGFDAGLVLDAGSLPDKSLAEGDELVKKLAPAASSAPQMIGWFSSADIVRRLAAAVRLVAEGQSPRPVLTFIELEGDFKVSEHVTAVPGKAQRGPRNKKRPKDVNERDFIAPASYARYDGLVKLFTSADINFAGRAYGQVRPYFESAFAEIAKPGERFDDVLTVAIRRLISVKVPEGPIEVVSKGANYVFKDPALEALSPAEKHVIRMGPANARAFQDTLRRFAAVAGLRI